MKGDGKLTGVQQAERSVSPERSESESSGKPFKMKFNEYHICLNMLRGFSTGKEQD